MTVATTNDLTFGYDDRGNHDAQPLVLLHGFPLNRSMWKHQLADLSESYRVIAVDLRGHGETTVTPGTVAMSEMASDVKNLLDKLSINESIHLGGLSMGGYVAWEFWLQFRQQLKSLLLFDTRAIADTEEVARARRMMASQVVTAGSQMAADSMLPKLVSDATKDNHPDVVSSVNKMILETHPEAIAATQRGMAERRDMTSFLSEVDLPTFVCCGEHDVISTPTEMREIASAMPFAEFFEVPGAGHLAPLEQPMSTNAALGDFLKRL